MTYNKQKYQNVKIEENNETCIFSVTLLIDHEVHVRRPDLEKKQYLTYHRIPGGQGNEKKKTDPVVHVRQF